MNHESVGLGFRLEHSDDWLKTPPPIGWIELLADNHLLAMERFVSRYHNLLNRYQISVHCVGMNVGGKDPLNIDYLIAVRKFAESTGAKFVSDHLCETASQGRQHHDLLPLEMTPSEVRRIAQRIEKIQELVRRPFLIENVSVYLRYQSNTMAEVDFFQEVCRTSGAKLLLDVNNIYVNAHNFSDDPYRVIDAINPQFVAQFHLAGYEVRDQFLLDTHSRPVSEEVWSLYRYAVSKIGVRPTMIEWDNELPDFTTLINECERTAGVISQFLSIRRKTKQAPAATVSG